MLKMQAAEIEVNARIEAADKVADDYFDECESSTGPLLLNAVVTPVVEIPHVHGATNNNVIPPAKCKENILLARKQRNDVVMGVITKTWSVPIRRPKLTKDLQYATRLVMKKRGM